MSTKIAIPGDVHKLDQLSSNGDFRIISAQNNPEVFGRVLGDQAFAEIEAYPHTGAFGRAYHPAVHDSHDCSFAVIVKDVPALICLCAPIDGQLSFYGLPLKHIACKGLDNDTRQAAIRLAFLYLDGLMEKHHLGEAYVLDDCGRGASPIEESCRLRGGTMNTRPIAYVDLIAGSAAWRTALRKSSRSLINWGRRNLSVSYVNKDT